MNDTAATGSPPVPPEEAARLALLSECRILDTPRESDFDDLTQLAAQICGTPIALISLIDGARQWFKSSVGLEVQETPRRLAFCAYGILEPERILIVPDATKDARFSANDLVTGELGIRFYAGAPLVVEPGLAVGSLCVIDRVPRELSDGQRKALGMLARQVVSRIQLSRKNFALEQAQAARDHFFNLPLDMLCIAGTDGFFRMLNPAFSEALGYTTEELLASSFLAFVHPEDVAPTLREIERLGQGLRTLHFENRYRRKDGAYIWLSWKCTPTADGTLYASARDITERKHSEQQLRALSELQRGILHSAAYSVIATDPSGIITAFNPAAEQMLGYAEAEMVGRATPAIFHVWEEVAARAEETSAELGVPLTPGMESLTAKTLRRLHNENEWTFIRKNGTRFPAQLSITGLWDDAKKIAGFLGVFIDVTERRNSEQRLKDSLSEKETLLQEVHHRVKNNLQIVSSLLQLQSEGLAEPRLLALFREAQDRVRAMALVHESLYRSGNLAAVNFASHLEELAHGLMRSYATESAPVRLDLQTQPASLDIDVAVPLSLIVNELVTNAFKHAFAHGRGGVLRIVFHEEADGSLLLSVADDGPGLPPEAMLENNASLGMKVVRILTTQIGGTLEVARAGGTLIALRFHRSRQN